MIFKGQCESTQLDCLGSTGNVIQAVWARIRGKERMFRVGLRDVGRQGKFELGSKKYLELIYFTVKQSFISEGDG